MYKSLLSVSVRDTGTKTYSDERAAPVVWEGEVKWS